MKKLMIATAAAAMVGGAFALPAVTSVEGYSYTATLKTTTARVGTQSTATYNFGQNPYFDPADPNNNVRWWYDDPVVKDGILKDYVGTTKVVMGNTIPVFWKANKVEETDSTKWNNSGLYLAAVNDKYGTTELLEAIETLAGKYDEKSANQWCDTIRLINPANCYRIAGTKRIDTKFPFIGPQEGIDCCTERPESGKWGNYINYGAFGLDYARIWYNVGQTNETPWVYADDEEYKLIPTTLYQRFGGQTSETARSVELYAMTEAETTDGDEFAGFLAGQGTLLATGYSAYAQQSGLLYYNPYAPRMVMGNIVGAIEAPMCENCCSDPVASVAFDCVYGDVPARLPLSAAYGTFQLMYTTILGL